MSARKKQRKHKAPEDEPFTPGDFARLGGVVLLLIALLMLTTTPHMVLRAWHRDGYFETTALITDNAVHGKNVFVRIPSLGEEFSFKDRGSLRASPDPVRVLYNGEARSLIELGAIRLTLLDSRVLPLTSQPLPTTAQAVGALSLNLLALTGSLLMIFQPNGYLRWRDAVRARRNPASSQSARSSIQPTPRRKSGSRNQRSGGR